MTKEMTVKKPDEFSIQTIIEKAVDKNVPAETMEKLLAVAKEMKAMWAKEQFDIAMADFQMECPEIKKDKDGGKTNAGVVAYRYAPLESIVRQVKNIINKHGFSYTINQNNSENNEVTVTCIVKHIAGHSEASSMKVPLGNKTQVMSNTQVVAAATTYAKRYAFINAFGIMTADEDTDGQTDIKENIKKAKPAFKPNANKISFMANLAGAKVEDIEKAYGKKLGQFTKQDFDKCLKQLDAKINKLNEEVDTAQAFETKETPKEQTPENIIKTPALSKGGQRMQEVLNKTNQPK